MQVRDYPWPLIDITGVTISGRMIFAEQEAQERGISSTEFAKCVSAVVQKQFGNIPFSVKHFVHVLSPPRDKVGCGGGWTPLERRHCSEEAASLEIFL